jgi:hypothetical protein
MASFIDSFNSAFIVMRRIILEKKSGVIVQNLVKMGCSRVCGAAGRSLYKQNPKQRIYAMRLKLILPVVDVERYEKAEECTCGCSGQEVWIHQGVRKPMGDNSHREVMARCIDRLAEEDAQPPRKGKLASLAYRLHNLFLARWNLWPRLTFYRSWQDPAGRTLDRTNNAT